MLLLRLCLAIRRMLMPIRDYMIKAKLNNAVLSSKFD